MFQCLRCAEKGMSRVSSLGVEGSRIAALETELEAARREVASAKEGAAMELVVLRHQLAGVQQALSDAEQVCSLEGRALPWGAECLDVCSKAKPPESQQSMGHPFICESCNAMTLCCSHGAGGAPPPAGRRAAGPV